MPVVKLGVSQSLSKLSVIGRNPIVAAPPLMSEPQYSADPAQTPQERLAFLDDCIEDLKNRIAEAVAENADECELLEHAVELREFQEADMKSSISCGSCRDCGSRRRNRAITRIGYLGLMSKCVRERRRRPPRQNMTGCPGGGGREARELLCELPCTLRGWPTSRPPRDHRANRRENLPHDSGR